MAFELLCNSLCGLLTKKLGEPWHREIIVVYMCSLSILFVSCPLQHICCIQLHLNLNSIDSVSEMRHKYW